MTTITTADLERDIARAENAMLKARCKEHQIAAQEAEQRAADLARRLAVVEGAAENMIEAVYGGAPLTWASAENIKPAAAYEKALVDACVRLRAALPAPRAEQDSPGLRDAGNMPDVRLSGALTDRSATSVVSPAPRVIEPGDVLRCERCRWPLAADATKGCVPGNCSFRCACSPGAHGMTCPLHHLNAKPTPIATPTQAASEGILEWLKKPGNAAAVHAVVAPKMASPAPAPPHTIMVGGLLGDRPYNERGTRAVAAVAGPYVRATPNATDEERARAWLDDMLRAHGREKPAHVLLELPHLLATIRTERDAAHRAEVAGSE